MCKIIYKGIEGFQGPNRSSDETLQRDMQE